MLELIKHYLSQLSIAAREEIVRWEKARTTCITSVQRKLWHPHL